MAIDATLRLPRPSGRPLPAPAIEARSAPPVTDNAVIVGRHDLTDSIARFRIRPDQLLPPVEPGQYLTLGLPVDGQMVQRPYSTATGAAVREELEFLIRRVPSGSFTPLLWKLGVGDRLRIGPPKGLFTRIRDDHRTHLFISTGTGLAPFVAMLETGRLEPDPPRAVVIHGVALAVELAYRERLEGWEADGLVRYVPSISRPHDPRNAAWSGRTGRVDAILEALLESDQLDPQDTVAYLCGQPGMIAAGTQVLLRGGLPTAAIRSEHYWPA